MLKRALRRLRTWAPPISIGVIVGASAFLIAERLAPPSQAAPLAIERPAMRASAPSRAYSNCDAARAAGAAPVHEGQPGYGPHLDADGDGVGCEPYHGR